MIPRYSTQRLFLAFAALGAACFTWLVADLRFDEGAKRGFTSELGMFLILVLRPLTILAATILLLGFHRGLKVAIWVVCLLTLAFWVALYLRTA